MQKYSGLLLICFGIIVLIFLFLYYNQHLPEYSLEGDCSCQETEQKLLNRGAKIIAVEEHKWQGPDDFVGFKVTYLINSQTKSITHYDGGFDGKGQHIIK